MNNQPQPDTSPVFVSRLRRAGCAWFAIALLAGCADGTMGNNQAIGTGVGVALGGLAGSFIGHGNTRIIGGLVGAAAGGLIGNRIGAALDERDRMALAAQSRAALAQQDGAPIGWASDHSGATATFVAANSHVETRAIPVMRDAAVEPASDLDIIGRAYQARSSASIHLAPRGDSAVGGSLAAGETITAVGKVRGAPWIAVARNGRTIGYVSDAAVAPATRPAPRPAAPVVASKAPSPPPASFDLDAPAPVRGAADLDALGPDTKVDTVTTAVPCRDLKTTVTAQGKSETSSQSACKSPDGSWELL